MVDSFTGHRSRIPNPTATIPKQRPVDDWRFTHLLGCHTSSDAAKSEHAIRTISREVLIGVLIQMGTDLRGYF